MIYRRSFLFIIIVIYSFTPLLSQQRGKATFYSKRATGTRTSSGERFHHDSLTCAHRTYPFGSLLKVTNPANDKQVIVKVIDRGPFSRGRIIDLSWKAANELDIISKGVATVIVEFVSCPNDGIPYRNDASMTLPEIDFEIVETPYSFIDKWKNDAKNNKPIEKKEMNTRQVRKKDRLATSPPATTDVPQTKPKTQHKEKDAKTWSDVFDKIKNFSEDIF